MWEGLWQQFLTSGFQLLSEVSDDVLHTLATTEEQFAEEFAIQLRGFHTIFFLAFLDSLGPELPVQDERSTALPKPSSSRHSSGILKNCDSRGRNMTPTMPRSRFTPRK